MGISAKYLINTSSISTLTLIFVRMGITASCCSASLYFMADPNPILGPPGVRIQLCMRGFFGFIGLSCAYQALRGLSVSDSVAIQFLTPPAAAVSAYLVLKETTTRREMIAGACSLFGVLLVSRPPIIFGEKASEGEGDGITPEQRLVGVGFALLAVLGSAGAYTTIRYIGERAHVLHSIGYFSYMCTIVSAIGLIILPGPIAWVTDWRGLFLIILIGIFGFVGQMLLTKGLQLEKAGRAGLAMYLQVFFSATLEYFVFDTIPAFLSVLGIGIILTSAVWVALAGKEPIVPQGEDEESRPFSRTPSPASAPERMVKGGLYAYTAVANEEEALSVPRVASRRGSETSDKSGDSR
ncbi:hypothetical protein P7C73_g2608, partial [Tremellales sp. Uapishka_1]